MYCAIARSQFERILDRLNGKKDSGPLCYIGAINLAEENLKKGKKVKYCLGSNEYNFIRHAWIEVDDTIYDTNRYRYWSDEDLIPTEQIELDPKNSLYDNFYKIWKLYDKLYDLTYGY